MKCPSIGRSEEEELWAYPLAGSHRPLGTAEKLREFLAQNPV